MIQIPALLTYLVTVSTNNKMLKVNFASAPVVIRDAKRLRCLRFLERVTFFFNRHVAIPVLSSLFTHYHVGQSFYALSRGTGLAILFALRTCFNRALFWGPALNEIVLMFGTSKFVTTRK